MTPWIRLALKEFWLPFHYRKAGCPGGRDFVWLTTFMALLLTLMLLLLASREGLLNRFVDVLLGNVPEYGVPVAVTNNMLSKGGVNAINTSVLTEIAALEKHIPGLSVHPYRTLEASLYPLVSLPDEQIWQNKRDDGSRFGPDFDGWAVYPDDPLWLGSSADSGFPLEIMLSRMLFDTYFDYNTYLEALQKCLPEELLKHLPDALEHAPSLEELWLQVTIGFRKELLPFHITWVPRFPVIDKIAYAFPLSTYHALKAAHDFPELRYFPEALGEGGSRVRQILVEMKSGGESSENQRGVEEFVAQLNGEQQNYRGDMLITFKHPLPQFWVDAYARQYRMEYDVLETVPGDIIGYQSHELLLPCGRLPNNILKERQFTSCTGDMREPVLLDVTARGHGFHHALVYIPDRTFLSVAATDLETVKENALSIHPSYQDALNRFGFLSKMLDALKKPYFLFLAIFLIAFLGIQMATLIGHHRHHYGVFLAKGMEWWQVYAMLWLQIVMALGFGMLIAVGVITGASLFLQSAIKSVASTYAETLSVADLNLLPLELSDYVIVAVVVLGIALVLATLLLYLLPLRRRTHPAALL